MTCRYDDPHGTYRYDDDDPDGIYQAAYISDPYDYGNCQFQW